MNVRFTQRNNFVIEHIHTVWRPSNFLNRVCWNISYHRSFLWASNSILYFGRQSTYLFLKWYHLFQHIYSRSARYKLLKCCQLTGLTVYPGIRPVIVSMIGALDDMHTSTIDVGLRISVYCTNSRWQARLSVRNVDCDRKSSNVRVGIKVPLFARTSMIAIDNRIC